MAGVSDHNNSDESEQSQGEEREVEEREDNALPCGIPDEGSPVWTWLLWGFFAVFLTIILGQTLIYSIFRGDITQVWPLTLLFLFAKYVKFETDPSSGSINDPSSGRTHGGLFQLTGLSSSWRILRTSYFLHFLESCFLQKSYLSTSRKEFTQ